MSEKQPDAQPPEPPEFNRKVSIYPLQLVGITLIVLIPLLALVGVFGEVEATADANNAAFALHVEYPLRTRHRIFETMLVTVTNESEQTYGVVTVRISADYINSFAEVAFDIEVEQITPEYYEFELNDVQAGESRVVGVELRADEYGERDGVIRVSAPDAAPLDVSIGTFVFP